MQFGVRCGSLSAWFGFPVFAEAEKELSDQLFDGPRSGYYQSFLSEMLKASWEDGVDVIGVFRGALQISGSLAISTNILGLNLLIGRHRKKVRPFGPCGLCGDRQKW
jgi:hypothetical protein